MSYSFGNNIKVSIFGKSHNDLIGATIDGLPVNYKINYELIEKFISLRKPINNLSTSRVEEDKVEFISGLTEGVTDGTPLTFIIKNNNIKSEDYQKGIIRPSTSDLTAFYKYNGANDFKGSGAFSGRLTLLYVVIGAICKDILSSKDIIVASNITNIHKVIDNSTINNINEAKEIELVSFPVINKDIKKEMEKEILKAKENLDSVGGVLETSIFNLPIGLGEPLFDSFESKLSSLLFSIGGIKGISFGDGFDLANLYGSESIDELSINDGKITFNSNHQGGINGGITNSNIVKFKTVMKATSSITKPVNSIDVINNKNIVLETKGRHDPCIVVRLPIIVNSLTYFVILDLYLDYLKYKNF